MMKQSVNLQDHFLNKARKESVELNIQLINGNQIKGLVKGFDNYTIILESNQKQQLIYKHSISTIIPVSKIVVE